MIKIESFAKQLTNKSVHILHYGNPSTDYDTDIYPTQSDGFQCKYGLTWSSGDLRLRSAKASPSCLCVCIIWDS